MSNKALYRIITPVPTVGTDQAVNKLAPIPLAGEVELRDFGGW